MEPYRLRRIYYAGLFTTKNTHQELHANQSFDFIKRKWGNEFDSEQHTYIRIAGTYEIKMQLIRLLSNIPYFIIIGLTACEIMAGRQTVAYLMLVSSLFNNLIGLLENIHLSTEKNISEAPFLNSFWDIQASEAGRKLNEKRAVSGEIQFADVTYRYPDADRNALHDISLNIPAQTKLVVIGENGSGKTTLTNLINGSYSPTEGTVTLPDNSCACVFQNAAHFCFTVRENIQIGNRECPMTDGEIWSLLDCVGLGDAVRRMPHGMDTMLGQLDDGTDLSMGQWQKLSVARLFAARDTTVWVLDEPTAYLDPLSEIDLYQEILRRAEDRTVIFVSHRLGFAVQSDLVLIMDNGSISDLGSHDALYAGNAVYREMIDGQRSWTEGKR